MTDSMLLQEYAQSGAPSALGKLASRHADWIYSAALRMVGDADLAQDVTQAVFLVLVRKAGSLQNKPLNAWLFGVTRYAAKDALRTRARRQRHERMAAMMTSPFSPAQEPETWQAIAPMLDELVDRLGQSDRQAVLLRFYQHKSMAEVGAALGVSEDAAKKRVGKAVGRLRTILAGRGVSIPIIALTAALTANTTHAAPSALIAACAAGHSAAGATAISQGVIAMMTMVQIKYAAAILLIVTLVPAVVAVVLQVSTPSPAPPAPVLAATQPDAVAPATEPTTRNAQDAVGLYLQANALCKVNSPSSTGLSYPPYPPYSLEWQQMAAAAWDADAGARQLARQARSLQKVDWPAGSGPVTDYLNPMLNLVNNLGDAALYADLRGNHAEAMEFVRDVRHMADLMRYEPAHHLTQVLWAALRDLGAADWMNVIASGSPFTNDPLDTHDIQVQTARQLIAQLLDQRDPNDQMVDVLGPKGSPAWQALPAARNGRPLGEAVVKNLIRGNDDRTMAAMSLACHLFLLEKGRWPDTAGELVPDYLPRLPIDPGGDGKQTFGYVDIPGGLPDGSDRPMVYCRYESQDGLFYTNRPQYGFYYSFNNGKNGGQFRDLARWVPVSGRSGPTTRPLPVTAP